MKTLSKLFVLIAIATVLGVCDSDRDGPNMDGSRTTEIERLWMDLPSYPGLSETHSYRSSRGRNARISRQYKSAASAPDVQSFYMREAIARGWVFTSQKKLSDWGRDLGGFELEFRKNDYTLDITYAGDKADYGWNYAIGIEWYDK
jgi:hypothetical protein